MRQQLSASPHYLNQREQRVLVEALEAFAVNRMVADDLDSAKAADYLAELAKEGQTLVTIPQFPAGVSK